MFLRNAWYIAAWADEVGDAPLGRRICNDPLVLFRDGAGRIAALEDRCCHRAAPLSQGALVAEGLQCGYHGLVFDGAGRCVRVPGQKLVPDSARVKSYPAVEKNQLVWVWMGEAAKADESGIVSYPYHDDPGKWPNKHDVYPIKGNYMLMVDNLMDLTHLGYLHARTVGGTPAVHIEAEMKTTRTATGLKFTRWLKNSPPPPSYVRAAGFRGRVDRWQEFEYVAPGAILQWTGAADVGTGTAATPETETSCFYFWSIANGYRQNDPEATQQLYGEIAPTFLEDKEMVERQQERLSEFGERGLTDIASDVNRAHMRRLIDRLIAAETAQAAE